MRNSMMHTCWRCSKKKNRVPRKMDQSHHGGGFRDLLMDQSHHGGGSRDLLMDQSHHGGGSRDLLRVCNERAEHNKRRKEDASLPSSSYGLLDSLPDVVVISCLARLSRLDQAALSLVSKSCRSLVASAEFKKTRSLMGCAEKYAYICLRMPPDPHPRWFVLRPTLVAATGKTVRQAHAIPSPPSQPPEGSAVVALDCGIYVVGGLVDGKPTSGVLLLDCWDHTWHHVSPMRVARASPGARVLDGKIYVLGGCEDDKNSSDWGEVFDPNTQTWADLPKPILEEDTDPDTLPRMDLIRDSVLIDDKVYVVDAGNKSFFYSPSQCQWGRGKKDWSEKFRIKRDWCVTGNLLYSCGRDGYIYWCEPGELDRCDGVGLDWRVVFGLDMQRLMYQLHDSRLVHLCGEITRVWESYKTAEKLEDLLPGAKLINFGRNILVFWDEVVGPPRRNTSQIWCAEISLDVRWVGRGYEMWGLVVWSSAILTRTADPLLYRSKLLYSISVDV